MGTLRHISQWWIPYFTDPLCPTFPLIMNKRMASRARVEQMAWGYVEVDYGINVLILINRISPQQTSFLPIQSIIEYPIV